MLAERYQYGCTANHRFTSFSMAKTLVAMAVGIAVAEGRINSINDAMDKYVPALAATAWKGVSIRHVMQMASGVRFDETYGKPDADISRLSRAGSAQRGSMAEVLADQRTGRLWRGLPALGPQRSHKQRWLGRPNRRGNDHPKEEAAPPAKAAPPSACIPRPPMPAARVVNARSAVLLVEELFVFG